MKTFNFLAVAGLSILLTGAAFAQSAVTISSPAQRVLQLSQAKVGDSTIVAYVQANPGDYQLTASGIIYLKQQGVSDQVITTMLNQHSAMQTADAPASVQSTVTYSQPAPTVVSQTAPTVVYSQPAPTVVYSQPPPTVIYTSPAPVYYPAYSYPASFPISLSFGWFGGNYYHGGGWGGFHGHGGFHR